MSFLKNRSLLTKFIQMRVCTISPLWRRNSSFRQVLPKFPYPSALNINRHQLVKPRPPPIPRIALAQLDPRKYMTPQLTKHKSRKCITFLHDIDKKTEAEAQERAKRAKMLQTEQLKRLMFDSDSDELDSNPCPKPKGHYSPWKLPSQTKQQQQSKQSEAKLQQQEHKSHGDKQESSRKHHKHTSMHQKQSRDATITVTVLKPLRQQQKHEHEHQQHGHQQHGHQQHGHQQHGHQQHGHQQHGHQQHGHQQHEYHLQQYQHQHQKHQQLKRLQQQKTEAKVEKQASHGEIKKFRVQHENMQKIKERDRKLKDHVEKLKIFDRINRLMKQQEEQDEKELVAYKAVTRTKDRDRNYQLHSARAQTQISTEQLRPRNAMHPAYASRFKPPLEFAPYTPTNAQSDNGDVASSLKPHIKSIPKLSPATEFHKDKAAAMESHLHEPAESRESALSCLCRYMNRQPKSKF